MSIHVRASDRGMLLARDLVRIGIPATQAKLFAKKFLRLAPRPGKVYKKAAVKTARRKKRVVSRLSGSGIVRIEGGPSNKIAIKRAQGEFVIEPLNAQRTPKSPSHKKQGNLSHK